MFSSTKSLSDALTEDELRPLFVKHDGNDSGTLEMPEARALLDDVRILYGLDANFTKAQADSLLKELDKGKNGELSWNEIRLLTKTKAVTLKKALTRVRSNKKASKSWGQWASDGVLGENATVAKAKAKKNTKKSRSLVFRPMRIEGIISSASLVSSFAPIVELRAVLDDPTEGRKKRTADALNEPYLASASTTPASDELVVPTWDETLTLHAEEKDDLHIHGFVCEEGMFGLTPLADFVVPLAKLSKAGSKNAIYRLPLQAIADDRVESGACFVVAYGGDGVAPRFNVDARVLRARSLPEEALVAELSIRTQQGIALAFARTEPANGPDPIFGSKISLQCVDEGNLVLDCRILSSGVFSDEVVAELERPIEQSKIGVPGPPIHVRLRPIRADVGGGSEIVLSLGGSVPISLVVRPIGASGVSGAADSWRFDPYFQVDITSANPHGNSTDVAVVVSGTTETIAGCGADPEWHEPILFPEIPQEPGMFVHMMLCAERFAKDPDMIADAALPLDDVVEFSKTPIERKIPLRVLLADKRRGEAFAYVMFSEKEMGGSVGARPNLANLAPVETRPAGGVGAAAIAPQVDLSNPIAQNAHNFQQASPGNAALPGNVAFNAQILPTVRAQPEDPRLEPYRVAAELRGGKVLGAVPLSFMTGSNNVHSVWLRPQR